MKKSILKEYIKILAEQEIEASKDSPFGQYLFAPDRKDLKNKIEEPNTPLEDMVFKNLIGHYAGSKKHSEYLAMDFFTLKSLLDKGYYKKLLAPPNTKLYRVISFNTASMKDFGFKEEDFKDEIVKKFDGGKLNTSSFGGPIQSWTTDFNKNFFRKIVGIGGSETLYPGDGVAIFMVNSPKGNFILNPNLPKYLKSADKLKKSGTNLEEENEVISTGPVSYDSVVVAYNPETIKDEEGNEVENDNNLKLNDYFSLLMSKI